MSEGEQGGSGQPPKRRRIALACTSCRTRKGKCDGVQPICGRCSALGYSCSYEGVANGSGPPLVVRLEEYQDLQERVQSLEGLLRQVEGRLSRVEGVPSTLGGSAQPVRSPNAPVATSSNDPTGVDAMGISYRPAAGPAHYGLSSAASMIDLLFQAIPSNPEEGLDLPVTSSGRSGDHTIEESGARSLGVPRSGLPSPTRANELLRIFVELIWPLYPIVGTSNLARQVASHLAAPSDPLPGEETTLGLFYSIFALSAAFVGAEEEGAAFFRNARIALGADELDGPPDSLLLVQSLIYLSLYLQSTASPSRAWHAIGRAIRVATSIGLHTAKPKVAPWEDDTEELASRAWYGCIVVDRFMSMSLGRPSDLHEVWGEPRVPRPLGDEAPDQLEYFVHCTKLSKIMGRVLSHLQSDPSATLLVVTGRESLGHELDAWLRRLPSWLSLTGYSGHNQPPPGAFMVTLRFYAVRMLLYRPFVRQAVRQPSSAPSTPGPAPEQDDFFAGFASCVSDAVETVRVLSRAGNQTTGLHRAGAAWYRLFFTFNAFTILASSLISDVDNRFPSHLLPLLPSRPVRLKCCEEAVALIDSLSQTSASAARCLGIAQKLLRGLTDVARQAISTPTSASLLESGSGPGDLWEWLQAHPFDPVGHGVSFELEPPLPDSLWATNAFPGGEPWDLFPL